jgi:ribonuclease P protein component
MARSPVPGGGRRRGRLSRSGDFDRVYREGRSHANRYLVVYAFPRADGDDEPEIRLGVSVGRKVGGAVERNAVKRALREAFWKLGEALPRRHDFVLVARPDAQALVEREGGVAVDRTVAELFAEAGITSGTVYRETDLDETGETDG